MWDILAKSGTSLATVAIVGILLGAGLPALYACGMRGLGMGRAVTADGERFVGHATIPGKLVAGFCFALVIVAAALGIMAIIMGKAFLPMFGIHPAK